jgi:hypothetical protein
MNDALTANQLYKQYQKSGGTLSFPDWITREKIKGTFELENGNTEFTIKKTGAMNKVFLGLPVKTWAIIGGVVVIAVVVKKIIDKK